jgi:hypothetical protein
MKDRSMPKPTLSRAPAFHEGDYLTDQRRLYRVLQVLPTKFKEWAAILEDCGTLDATLFRPDELERMELRVVRAASP